MSGKSYRVKDVARLAGVTVRTLHHYDRIGLLVPSGRTGAGYRLYGEDDLLRLQQILICRELGLPLEQIKRMLDDPRLDRKVALLAQREQLVQRLGTTEAMIRSVDAALEALKGEHEMDPKQLFDGFDPQEHEQEAQRRWGGTDAYKEAARRTQQYSREDWTAIKAENEALMSELAAELEARSEPGGERAMELAERHRLHIDRWYYPCPPGMHAGLAEMYVSDERFRASFDRHGEGLAAFLAEAIRANAARRR